MKRFFRISTAVLLLISTTGITLSKHYCGEILSEIYLTLTDEKCCGEADNEPMGCCHTESETYEIEHEFKFQHTLEFNHSAEYFLLKDLTVLFSAQTNSLLTPNSHKSFTDSSPPLNSPVIIMNQVFRL